MMLLRKCEERGHPAGRCHRGGNLLISGHISTALHKKRKFSAFKALKEDNSTGETRLRSTNRLPEYLPGKSAPAQTAGYHVGRYEPLNLVRMNCLTGSER